MDIHVEDIEHFYNNTNKNVSINNANGKNSMEEIPENNFSVNVVKQNKKALETRPIKQSQQIPKVYAKMNRPIQPEPKQQVTYDDILSKMGMFVMNGELHLKGNGYPNQNTSNTTSKLNAPQPNGAQNSYIYNKYFKDAFNNPEEPQRPKNAIEYRDMLIKDIIQKAKIKQIKSKKLIMPTSNINLANGPSDLNKLFAFSQR